MLKIEHTLIEGWEPSIRGMRNSMNSWDKSDSHYICGDEFCKLVEKENCPVYCHAPHYIIGPEDLKLMMKLRNGTPDERKYMRMIAVWVDVTAPLYWWKEYDTYKVGTVANSCSTMHKIHAKEFVLDDFSHEHLFSYDPDKPTLFGMTEVKLTAKKVTHLSAIDLLNITIDTLNQYREAYLEADKRRAYNDCHGADPEIRKNALSNMKKYWWQMIQLLGTSYNQKRTLMLNYEVLANIYRARRNHKLDEWHTFCDWIEELPYSEIITGGKK